MKRDKMRIFAWCLVGIGVLVWCLGIFAAIKRSIDYDQQVEIWQTIRGLNRSIISMGGMPPGPMPAPPATALEVLVALLGLGAGPVTLGVIILAIRRPAPGQPRASIRVAINRLPGNIARFISGPPAQPLPKATPQKLPPWEKQP